MSKKEMPKGEKYVLTLSREQAIMVKDACELFARLKIGQFDRITEMMLDYGQKDYHDKRYLANALLRLAACAILGSDEYRMPHMQHDELHHRAWNIHAVIRHCMAWHDNPEGNIWSVNFDKPYPHGDEALPEIEIKETCTNE